MNSTNRKLRRSRPFWIWIPLVVIAGIISIFVAAYFSGALPAHGYLPFYYFPWWIIFPIFFFGLFFAFRCWGWGYWRGSRGYYYDPALEVLRQRFARGEITKDQYEQMTKELEAAY
ncbi:MAG TPA: SHOCT domain-containing protein [Nitrososphaerales archaeon]|nr:SHOCT domain-containing protein [Nitrososphaerales archaeon]